MRASNLLKPTLRDTPSDAEIISHKLMLRAGLIRKIAAGIYTWLPLGLKVLRKVETIVREEMDRSGAQELLMSGVQPAELWKESNRYVEYGAELLRFSDRHEREFCLGPTHEEVITSLFKNEIKSYKQLPVNLYQIQTKFRDEIRPRFGIMRAREFLMKDAYSFHIDTESLEETYNCMFQTYKKIFEKVGLNFRAVLADTGNIGGSKSHEFHVLAESGEDSIAYNSSGSYSANLEMVPVALSKQPNKIKNKEVEKIHTPGIKSISEVCDFFKVSSSKCIKTLVCHGTNGLVALALRGDHEINLIKLQKIKEIKVPFEFADESKIIKALNCKTGSIGPIGLEIPLIIDNSASELVDFICGANSSEYHYKNANWSDCKGHSLIADIRNATAGDPAPNGDGLLKIQKGIEVGHIFQLGEKYSRAMKAKVLDQHGKEVIPTMGCYGIGVSRIVAASIEQNHDSNGIIWPTNIAPFLCAIVPIGYQKSNSIKTYAEEVYSELCRMGIDTLLCDEDKRAGVMFSDIELIGIPFRIVISEKNVKEKLTEVKIRKTGEIKLVKKSNVGKFIQEKLRVSND